MHARSSLFSVLLLAFFAAGSLSAQSGALIQGTVRAQGGLGVEGVRVGFSPDGAVGAGATTSTTTDAAGRFELTVTPGGTGTLTFTREGYLDEFRSVETGSAGETLRIAVTLVPLYTLDAVTVTARRERPLLNTDDAETGGTVEGWEIAALPSEARNPLELAFSVPGVSQSTGFFGDAPPLTIHGENSLYTQYLIDGLDNNEGFLGGPRVQFPLAGLERLAVHASAYRPAFGRSSNGVVDYETKAGGAAWEGEVFVANRPGTPLDADPKFAPAGIDPDGFERTQVGGSIGGPITEDRTFVFATAEYSNEREDRIGSTARTAFLGTELRETWKLFARLDHGWSPTQTTTFRFAFSDNQREGRGGGVIVPEADVTTVRRGSLANLTHYSALRGGRAANEFSIQLGTFRWDFPPSASDLSTPQVTVVAADETTVEAVVGSSNFVFDESELQIQLKEVFEARIGDRHTLRFGADLLRSSFELTGANTNPRGAYTVVDEGNIEASGRFLSIDDIPADVRVLRYTLDANPQQVDLNQTLWGAFVENRWRVSPSLTLQGGVRWDYDDITSRGESEADLDNFQPRVSFNWFATPTQVVRGGWGLYAGKFPYAVYSDAVQFGPEGNATVTFEGEDFPPPAFLDGPTASELDALRDELPPREVRRTFARGLEQPMASQLALGWQAEFAGGRWGISVDGVWTETRNLPRSWDLNAIERPLQPGDSIDRSVDFGDDFRPDDPAETGYRRLTTTDSGGTSDYLGLFTTLRRSFTERLSLEASWVWSRARNDTEDINFNAAHANDFAAEWADAVNDRRHHLTLRGVWEPIDRLVVSGIADWQTGTPINRVAFFRDLDGSGAIFGNGFVGNHDRFFGVGRNQERLPSALTLDLSAGYALALGGGELGIRAEVFNLFNATQYTGFANGIPGGGPRTQVGRPGDPIVYTTAAPPRQFQLSASWAF